MKRIKSWWCPLLVGLFVFAQAGCTSQTAMEGRSGVMLGRTASAAPMSDLSGPAGGRVANEPAPTTALAAPKPEAQTVVQVQRQVVYTGALTVLSPDPAGAIDAVKQLADRLGGYATNITAQAITIRVPATQFDAAMDAVAELGLVTDRNVQAADVTEELLDLDIRLNNLEALRERMKALLEKADKVEDALKIEQELGRLTTEIERIKGKLRFLKDQVALSTITVRFNAPRGTSSGLATRVRPFPWVNTVGGEAFGAARLPQAQSRIGKGARIDLPEGFVRFYQQDYRVFAIDRGQVVLKVTRHANYDQADTSFWVDQVRDRLTEELGVPISAAQRVTIRDNDPGYVMTGNRPAGKDRLGYFVGLSATDDYVYAVEAWGPADQVEQQHGRLIESLRTLRVSRFW